MSDENPFSTNHVLSLAFHFWTECLRKDTRLLTAATGASVTNTPQIESRTLFLVSFRPAQIKVRVHHVKTAGPTGYMREIACTRTAVHAVPLESALFDVVTLWLERRRMEEK